MQRGPGGRLGKGAERNSGGGSGVKPRTLKPRTLKTTSILWWVLGWLALRSGAAESALVTREWSVDGVVRKALVRARGIGRSGGGTQKGAFHAEWARPS